MKVSVQELEGYVSKGIKLICPHKYVGKNNCAHFVGHALDLQLGILCNLTHKHEKGRASVRVNDIYNNLRLTGLWKDKPPVSQDQALLIFVTSASNVDGNDIMSDNPDKHIGVVSGDKVYNYSNHHKKVVSDTVDSFFDKCDNAYPQDDVTLYYGIVE
jgi:hypothetical protein